MNLAEKETFYNKVLPFFEQIGLPFCLQTIAFETFLPGIGLHQGKLWIDKEQLAAPGDVLHEAGHYAVTRTKNRVDLGQADLVDNDELNGKELTAMLWSYAVCLHLAIDPTVVFHKDGYKGQSEMILGEYAKQNYFGLPLLQWMGLAHYPDEGLQFPKMKQWLRP